MFNEDDFGLFEFIYVDDDFESTGVIVEDGDAYDKKHVFKKYYYLIKKFSIKKENRYRI
jgi:hypothetical protein